MPSDADTTTQLASAPFDDPAGDIVLRSNDKQAIDFRTHKLFLIYASTVFKDMFSLPQGGRTNENAGVPVVVMHEKAEELRSLLVLCYPGMVLETPTSLERFWVLYLLTDKYMLDNAKVWLRGCLLNFVQEMPTSVYLIARKAGWRKEARDAAKECLSHSLAELVSERHPIFQVVSAQTSQDLFLYHQERET